MVGKLKILYRYFCFLYSYIAVHVWGGGYGSWLIFQACLSARQQSPPFLMFQTQSRHCRTVTSRGRGTRVRAIDLEQAVHNFSLVFPNNCLESNNAAVGYYALLADFGRSLISLCVQFVLFRLTPPGSLETANSF